MVTRFVQKKATQLSNRVPNQICNFPEKYGLQNKENIIFWSKGCLFIECSFHQFNMLVFFNQKQHKSVKSSNSYISAYDSGKQLLTGVRHIWLFWVDQLTHYNNLSGLAYL